MTLCTLTNTVQSAGNDPGGGGPGSGSQALSVLWTVSAELKGYDNPPNDGVSLVDRIFAGTVTNTPIVITGYVAGYRNKSSYVLQVPFVDSLFQGATPLSPPYSVYYLITETYLLNLFPVQQGNGQADRYTITRKVRPLSPGGLTQSVSATLI